MKKYLMAGLAALTLGCGGANVEVRDGKSSGLEKELQQKVVDSKECSQIYWTSIPPGLKNDRVLICTEKIDDKYKLKQSINLDNICDVYLKENYNWYSAPFEWMWGDDVVIETKEGNIYSLRFWDKPAREIYEILDRYVKQNVKSKEELKCQK